MSGPLSPWLLCGGIALLFVLAFVVMVLVCRWVRSYDAQHEGLISEGKIDD